MTLCFKGTLFIKAHSNRIRAGFILLLAKPVRTFDKSQVAHLRNVIPALHIMKITPAKRLQSATQLDMLLHKSFAG